MGIGSLGVHRRNHRPLIGRRIVSFGAALPILPVISAASVNQSIQSGHTHVTTAIVHRSYLSPFLCDGIEHATRIEVLHSVEASDTVDFLANNCRSMVRSRTGRILFGHTYPAIGPCVVRLDICLRQAGAPAADGEDHLMRQSWNGQERCGHLKTKRFNIESILRIDRKLLPLFVEY